MSRTAIAILLAAVSAGCMVDPIKPNLWSLAATDSNSNEVFLGGHYSLDACRKAGVDWFNAHHGQSSVLQCRLNCRKLGPDGATECEATEPVG